MSYVSLDFGVVRIVSSGDPFNTVYDICVEWMIDGEWKLYRGFNSLSDDYANTNAREAAALALTLIKDKVV